MLNWYSVPQDVFNACKGRGYPTNVKTWHFGDHSAVSYMVYGNSDDLQKIWFGW
jgi:hypothetical protein